MLKIVKGGRLIENKWVYDEAKDGGSYQDFDITDQAIRNLFKACDLEEGVTLRDIFMLLNKDLKIWDAIIGNWCEEIVTEGLTKPAKAVGTYDPEEIEYLELYFSPEFQKGLEGSEDGLHGFLRPNFGGVGWELLQDSESTHGFKAGERIPWGISVTPANELIDLPVKLRKTIEIIEDDYSTENMVQGWKSLITLPNPEYSLGQILYGIIWEMSFHGGPDKRNEFKEELDDITEKIKNGDMELSEFAEPDKE